MGQVNRHSASYVCVVLYLGQMTSLREIFDRSYTTEPNTGCWLWTGFINEDGYGTLIWGNKNLRAHRLAFELKYGREARPMALHRCVATRSCVNPDHIYEGDHKQNMIDAMMQHRHPFMHLPVTLPTPKKIKGIKSFAKEVEALADIKPQVTDLEISKQTGVPLRSTQRYLASLKRDGIIRVENIKHLHYAFGWCNSRTLKFLRSY